MIESTGYTPQSLQRSAKDAALFSARELHLKGRPSSVLWSLTVFDNSAPRLEVEYLVKGDHHPHSTSVLL